MKVAARIWTNEEKEYLKEITPGRHYKEIVELMNQKFIYQFTISQIKGAIGRYKLNTGFNGQFQKGIVPFNKGTKGLTSANKTSFKKGQKPLNYRPVGSERINVYGYIEIKIADPRKWMLKQRFIWELYNGKIPKDHNIIFGDGDKLNTDINNLILVSKKQQLVINTNNLIKDDIELTKTGVLIANLIIKTSEIAQKKGGK